MATPVLNLTEEISKHKKEFIKAVKSINFQDVTEVINFLETKSRQSELEAFCNNAKRGFVKSLQQHIDGEIGVKGEESRTERDLAFLTKYALLLTGWDKVRATFQERSLAHIVAMMDMVFTDSLTCVEQNKEKLIACVDDEKNVHIKTLAKLTEDIRTKVVGWQTAAANNAQELANQRYQKFLTTLQGCTEEDRLNFIKKELEKYQDNQDNPEIKQYVAELQKHKQQLEEQKQELEKEKLRLEAEKKKLANEQKKISQETDIQVLQSNLCMMVKNAKNLAISDKRYLNQEITNGNIGSREQLQMEINSIVSGEKKRNSGANLLGLSPVVTPTSVASPATSHAPVDMQPALASTSTTSTSSSSLTVSSTLVSATSPAIHAVEPVKIAAVVGTPTSRRRSFGSSSALLNPLDSATKYVDEFQKGLADKSLPEQVNDITAKIAIFTNGDSAGLPPAVAQMVKLQLESSLQVVQNAAQAAQMETKYDIFSASLAGKNLAEKAAAYEEELESINEGSEGELLNQYKEFLQADLDEVQQAMTAAVKEKDDCLASLNGEILPRVVEAIATKISDLSESLLSSETNKYAIYLLEQEKTVYEQAIITATELFRNNDNLLVDVYSHKYAMVENAGKTIIKDVFTFDKEKFKQNLTAKDVASQQPLVQQHYNFLLTEASAKMLENADAAIKQFEEYTFHSVELLQRPEVFNNAIAAYANVGSTTSTTAAASTSVSDVNFCLLELLDIARKKIAAEIAVVEQFIAIYYGESALDKESRGRIAVQCSTDQVASVLLLSQLAGSYKQAEPSSTLLQETSPLLTFQHNVKKEKEKEKEIKKEKKKRSHI